MSAWVSEERMRDAAGCSEQEKMVFTDARCPSLQGYEPRNGTLQAGTSAMISSSSSSSSSRRRRGLATEVALRAQGMDGMPGRTSSFGH
ncbi:hypothetical protein ColLi_02690 [Colletotrichum liriopes]|uniref:Uncharacterized protein n=1 Tax=Colletotrichum liriopes TaxID=708192 RepID=A0AA37GFR3_9PEZI|nr:hypothetical protein ColLi_02690 [Colletotrichum liriopes]